MNTYILLLLSLLAIQTQLYSAVSSNTSVEEHYNSASKQLIDLYTDVFLQRVGAGTRLTNLTQTLLSNGAGAVVLSTDIYNLAHKNLKNNDLLKLRARTVAELIYLVRNIATDDTLEILKIKKLLYTAVQHNLLHSSKYNFLGDKEAEYYKQAALDNIAYQLDTIDAELR